MAHFAKYKGINAFHMIEHDARENTYLKENIDKERSHLNYNLCNIENPKEYLKELIKMVKEKRNLLTKSFWHANEKRETSNEFDPILDSGSLVNLPVKITLFIYYFPSFLIIKCLKTFSLIKTLRSNSLIVSCLASTVIT